MENILDALKAGNAESKRQALGEIILLDEGLSFASSRAAARLWLRTREDCEDLVNGFFSKCIEGEGSNVRTKKGKCRNFLARSFKQRTSD